jgi:hypothetical protein
MNRMLSPEQADLNIRGPVPQVRCHDRKPSILDFEEKAALWDYRCKLRRSRGARALVRELRVHAIHRSSVSV